MATLTVRLSTWTGLSRTFASFLGGMAISKQGDALYLFALPWIAYEMTASPVVMSTLYATEIIPILLFGALAGVVVDRWDRRKLMLWSDVLRAAIVAAIPLLHLLGALQVWHLYVAAFSLAQVSLVFDVATTAVIPEMAGSDLTRANATFQMVNQGASMAGPAIAGLVIATVGGLNALWIDALSFGGTFLAILTVPTFRQQPQGLTAGGVLKGVVAPPQRTPQAAQLGPLEAGHQRGQDQHGLQTFPEDDDARIGRHRHRGGAASQGPPGGLIRPYRTAPRQLPAPSGQAAGPPRQSHRQSSASATPEA